MRVRCDCFDMRSKPIAIRSTAERTKPPHQHTKFREGGLGGDRFLKRSHPAGARGQSPRKDSRTRRQSSECDSPAALHRRCVEQVVLHIFQRRECACRRLHRERGGVVLGGDVREHEAVQYTAQLSQIPILKCWPQDGGRFITLPQSAFDRCPLSEDMRLFSSSG